MKPIQRFFKALIENVAANVLASIVLGFFLPTATYVNSEQTPKNDNTMWTPPFIASIIIGVFLVLLFQFVRILYFQNKELKAYVEKTKEQLRIQNEIIKQRGFNLYLIATASVQYHQVPGIPLRTKDGDYYKYLQDEKQLMRNKLINSTSYKDVSIQEIDAIVEKFYEDFQ